MERLTTDDLNEMRTYISDRLNHSKELHTTNESLQSDDALSMTKEIAILSVEANRQLQRLSNYCDRLYTGNDQDCELVEELREFIAHAKDTIDQASSEPEMVYPNIDKHRCHDLKEITSQIKANQSLIMPVIKLQAKKPQATRKLLEQAPTSNPDPISDLETPPPSRRG